MIITRSPIATQADSPPGSWWLTPAQSADSTDQRNCFVSVKCPICRQSSVVRYPLSAERGHAIAADGTVSPSLVCPYKPCSWHEWVRLEGWVP